MTGDKNAVLQSFELRREDEETWSGLLYEDGESSTIYLDEDEATLSL